ncbi:MAG: hypothetical protein GWO16_02115 [Gammaproteobacteria bacterium]|nr:hypothetical protein [Gammaproteobacteria bacterium]NIR96956.1 hypothetical protein [Gammaproteobacteria bacterium]NIT62658.1 hypothetical protein [Gammaproteobacteria bacterium]NIV19618.1 hypothetical protein [Gammaproteobacteria bacterium]NIX10838.1 hypothetical protein [Gammaproteobacteria bacterium]
MSNVDTTFTRYAGRVALALLGLGLVACSAGGGAGQHTLESGESLMLLFQETEPGLEPYATRMLINDAYVRMDDGNAASDYVLFDRDDETVYSVSHANRSILVIHSKPVLGESPIPLEMDARRSKHPNAPPVAGHQPVQYTLLVNGQSCSQVMVVPGMLQEGIMALREFRRVLAGQHAENLPKTPEEMLDPCFVAYHVFAPVQHLQYGFPIQQWDSQGVGRSLVDYDEAFKTDSELFVLPESYPRMGVGLGGGAAVEGDTDA